MASILAIEINPPDQIYKKAEFNLEVTLYTRIGPQRLLILYVHSVYLLVSYMRNLSSYRGKYACMSI